MCAVLLIRLNNSTLDVSLLYEDLANFYIRCNLKVVTGQCDFTTILFMASQQVIDRRLEAGSERYIGLLKYYVKDFLLNLDKCLTDNIWLYNMYKSDIIEYVEKEIEDQPDIQVEHTVFAFRDGIHKVSDLRNDSFITNTALFEDRNRLIITINFIYLFGMGNSEVIDTYFETFIEDGGLSNIDLQA